MEETWEWECSSRASGSLTHLLETYDLLKMKFTKLDHQKIVLKKFNMLKKKKKEFTFMIHMMFIGSNRAISYEMGWRATHVASSPSLISTR